MIRLLLLATYDPALYAPSFGHVGKATAHSVSFHFAESHFIEQPRPAATTHCAYCNVAQEQPKASKTHQRERVRLCPFFFSFLVFAAVNVVVRGAVPLHPRCRLRSISLLISMNTPY